MVDERSASYPLADTTLRIGGRRWTITAVQDQNALVERVQTDADLERFPYGLLLWASAIGLAEELAARPALVAGKRVLELGAGVGLPGIVAQSLGAAVTQTDHQEAALDLARRNAEQNGVAGIRTLLLDWRRFDHDERYDVVLGSDVLYERTLHASLAALFPRLLAPAGDGRPDGLLLVSDPLRPQALDFMDSLERRGGWSFSLESRRVAEPGGGVKEIALFFARTVG
jgi:predicted nicotinamide N-methyase